TIVELLVVMAVIGVLLSLAVFGIQALQKNQRETQRLNDLRNIQGSLESFYSKNKRYPTMAELTVLNDNLNDKDFQIKIATEANAFATIPVQSLTPTKYAAAVTYDGADCVANLATADTWHLFYQTADSSPQEYALYACTENGKSTNLGSKITAGVVVP
ncbi:MAG: type II secretion system protein, partial [bacterium]